MGEGYANKCLACNSLCGAQLTPCILHETHTYHVLNICVNYGKEGLFICLPLYDPVHVDLKANLWLLKIVI